MPTEKQKAIYIDLNGLQDGFIPFTTLNEWRRLLVNYPKVVELENILLWSDDLNDLNEPDPFVFFGKFNYNQITKQWGFVIKNSDLVHLSQNKELQSTPIDFVM